MDFEPAERVTETRIPKNFQAIQIQLSRPGWVARQGGLRVFVSFSYLGFRFAPPQALFCRQLRWLTSVIFDLIRASFSLSDVLSDSLRHSLGFVILL